MAAEQCRHIQSTQNSQSITRLSNVVVRGSDASLPGIVWHEAVAASVGPFFIKEPTGLDLGQAPGFCPPVLHAFQISQAGRLHDCIA